MGGQIGEERKKIHTSPIRINIRNEIRSSQSPFRRIQITKYKFKSMTRP